MNYSIQMTIADNEALIASRRRTENESKCALLLAEVILPSGDRRCCYAISGLSPNALLPLYLRGSRFAHLDARKYIEEPV